MAHDAEKHLFTSLNSVLMFLRSSIIDTRYFLIPHLCEKNWINFLSRPSNELIEYVDEIMKLLKNMMYSFTEDSLKVAASIFEEATVWNNSEKLRNWFQASWLHRAKVNFPI